MNEDEYDFTYLEYALDRIIKKLFLTKEFYSTTTENGVYVDFCVEKKNYDNRGVVRNAP